MTHDQAVILLPNDRAQIDEAQARILHVMERLEYPEAGRFAVRLALEEAIANAFNHGHRGLPPETTVSLSYRADREAIDIAVEDQGPGFNPGVVPDPTLDENLELPTGRGLLLMRSFMSRVEYIGRGNRVEMTFRHPQPTNIQPHPPSPPHSPHPPATS